MPASTDNTLISTNSTAANFRAWGSRISTALGASGWVQTADTGQINWTTVAAPSATNQSMGYEIWRMADALQATFPVFVKIEYGSGGTSAAFIGIWITIGNGSNGSGTLTNPNTRTQLNAMANDTVATGYSSLFSGNTNRFACCLFNHATLGSRGILFFIERSKDGTGADNGNFVLFSGFFTNSSSFNCWTAQVGQPSSNSWRTVISNANGSCNITGPNGSSGTTGAIGADVAVYAYLLSDGGAYLNAGISCIGVFIADFVALNTYTVVMYGVSRTFKVLASVGPYNALANRAGSYNMTPAMLYE